MAKVNLSRFIKNDLGEKTEMTVTSINLETRQKKFLEEKKINLSALIRDYINQLIKEQK